MFKSTIGGHLEMVTISSAPLQSFAISVKIINNRYTRYSSYKIS